MISEFKRIQFLPVNKENAWNFFSSPLNLSLITPPDLGLELCNSEDCHDMYLNQLIEYKVRPILNFPLKWKTKITKVEYPNLFVDKQISGPYKLWEHLHEFEEVDGGILMKDVIKYELPFDWLGNLFSAMIRKKLDQIFLFRKRKLEKLLQDGHIH